MYVIVIRDMLAWTPFLEFQIHRLGIIVNVTGLLRMCEIKSSALNTPWELIASCLVDSSPDLDN